MSAQKYSIKYKSSIQKIRIELKAEISEKKHSKAYKFYF